MCGMAGVAGAPEVDERLLRAMAGAIASRGPDAEGVWTGPDVGLASRRLAIIDLDERSNQPMALGPLRIAFNGEIYNYVELREELRAAGHDFRTEGDTEVLLHAWAEWGETALERLNGMFAFAVWDGGARTLTLARDAFGEKPLHYHRAGRRLAFASEIKALLQDPHVAADPGRPALAAFVARGAMPAGGRTFLRDVSQVPAAHLLRWRDGAVELRPWWRPVRREIPARYADTVAELRELLLDSIHLRLRSDVPVGTSLSGGVDSSSVVALSARLGDDGRRHAFTARFPGFERDEWRYAHQVAQAARVRSHHPVEPTADELLDDLDALVHAHDEPIGSTSIYAQWRIMRAAREQGVVVLLDGQGGDELFAGYPGMSGFVARARGLRGGVGMVARDPSQAPALARALALDVAPRALARHYRRRAASVYAAPEVAAGVAEAEPPYETWMHAAPDALRRELLLQAFATSLPELLRYADRNSMAHSVEVRLPILDRRVAELAFSLPAAHLHRRGLTKSILRDAARGLVPEAVLARRDKVGFATPERRWLDTDAARARIAEVILDPGACGRELYDVRAVERDFAARTWRKPRAIWWALSAELWLRRLADRRATAAAAAA